MGGGEEGVREMEGGRWGFALDGFISYCVRDGLDAFEWSRSIKRKVCDGEREMGRERERCMSVYDKDRKVCLGRNGQALMPPRH